MKHTESELTLINQRNLYLFDLFLKNNKAKLEEIGELIPGMFHINSKEDVALKYMNKSGCELLNNDIKGIQKGGVELICSVTHRETIESIQPMLIDFYSKQDENKVISYFQKLKFNRDKDYKLYISTTKILKEEGGLITFTVPVCTFGDLAIKIEKVFDEHTFMKKNFERFAQLTKREKQILSLIAVGKSTKEIAEYLFISKLTVNTHRQNIIKKLDTSRIAELIRFAETFDLL